MTYSQINHTKVWVSKKNATKKLQVLMHEHIQVCDCWYDKQKRGNVDPMFLWKDYECKIFGHLCRDHNEIIQGNGKHKEYLEVTSGDSSHK